MPFSAAAARGIAHTKGFETCPCMNSGSLRASAARGIAHTKGFETRPKTRCVDDRLPGRARHRPHQGL